MLSMQAAHLNEGKQWCSFASRGSVHLTSDTARAGKLGKCWEVVETLWWAINTSPPVLCFQHQFTVALQLWCFCGVTFLHGFCGVKEFWSMLGCSCTVRVQPGCRWTLLSAPGLWREPVHIFAIKILCGTLIYFPSCLLTVSFVLGVEWCT